MDTQRPRIALTIALIGVMAFSVAQPGGPRRPKGGPDGPGIQLSPVLRRMIEATGRLKYSGQRVVEFRVNGERVQNVEFVLVDGRNTRVEFGEGSPSYGKIIVENARGRFQFDPVRNEIEQTPSQRDELVGRLRGMVAGPRRPKVVESVGGNVAGRPTTMVTFSDPRGNPIQRIWVDNDYGLALRREVFDPSGSRVGFFEFKRVNYRPNIRPEDFEIRRKGAKMLSPTDRLRSLGRETGMQIMMLAPSTGAELVNSRTLGERNDTVMLVYRLGQDRLSLFQTKGKVNDSRLRRFGGERVQSHQWSARGYTFVLIGEIGVERLQRLAGSLVDAN